MRHRVCLWLMVLGTMVSSIAVPTRAVASSWTNIFTQGGVQAIAITPTSPGIIYVGTSGNGLYRSTNGGSAWEQFLLPQSGGYIWSLAIHPTTPTIIYAGTAGGVARSTNSGDSWTFLSDSSYYVNTLVLDPVTPNTVYIGTGTRGIYRSTDGGSSWSAINTGLPPTQSGPSNPSYDPIQALVIDSTTPTTLYALTSGKVYRTTNAGASWSQVTTLSGYQVSSLAIAQTTPKTIYAGTISGLFQSTDGGATWRASASALTLQYARAIVIDPSTPSTLYAANGAGDAGVHRSTDGGETWAAFNDGLPTIDLRTLALDPTNPATIYAGAGQGLFRNVILVSPTISTQPLNHRIRPGTAVTLDVIAGTGTAPFSYQWYGGLSGDTSQPVPGATARTFTTPPLNADTAYWVRVNNTAGSVDSTTAHISIKGAYTPTLDGFNNGATFNNFAYTPGDAIPGASWEIFKRTFPANSMELPNGQPRFGARTYFRSQEYRGVGAGNCFGMAAVSMLRYLDSPDTLEREVLNPYYRRFTQVADLPPIVAGAVTVGRSNVKDYIFLYQGRQQSVQIQDWLSRHAQDTPAQTFDAIRQITQAGNVAMLVFWYRYPTGWAGHAVVAYGTEQAGSTGTIAIYDPNWPGNMTRRLTVDLSLNQWHYELWQGTTWSGSRELRYVPLNMLYPAYVSLPQAGVATAQESDTGIVLGVEGAADLLITDGQGRQFGPETLDPTQEISGALRLVTAGFNPDQPTATSPEAYYLPSGQPYTVTVQRAAGAELALAATAAYTLTAFGDGSALTVGGTSLAGAQGDTLTLQGTPRDTTFTPATDGAYCQTITDEISAENSRAYSACITDGAGVPATFTIDTDRSFTVQNAGARAISVAVTTYQVGSLTGDGASTATIAPGQSLAAPPPLAHVYVPLLRR